MRARLGSVTEYEVFSHWNAHHCPGLGKWRLPKSSLTCAWRHRTLDESNQLAPMPCRSSHPAFRARCGQTRKLYARRLRCRGADHPTHGVRPREILTGVMSFIWAGIKRALCAITRLSSPPRCPSWTCSALFDVSVALF